MSIPTSAFQLHNRMLRCCVLTEITNHCILWQMLSTGVLFVYRVQKFTTSSVHIQNSLIWETIILKVTQQTPCMHAEKI